MPRGPSGSPPTVACACTPPAGWVHLGADAGMPSIDVRRIIWRPTAIVGSRRLGGWFASVAASGACSGGQRWLPSDDVVDLVAIDEATVAVRCADGSVGGIRAVETTLAAKAEAIEAAIDERHRRHGYVE